MSERYGLFTLIVLGEAILAVANSVAHIDWGWDSVLTGLGGFLIAVTISWLYFGYADDTVVDRALHGSRVDMARAIIYAYSHLLIYPAIIVTSVGIGLAIDEAHEPMLPAGTRAALFGGVAAVLAAMTVSQWAMPYGVRPKLLLVRLGLIALFLVLALVGRALPPVALVSVLAIGLIGLILVELMVYAQEEEAASA
jgi:low temperature requirement protein LtrA